MSTEASQRKPVVLAITFQGWAQHAAKPRFTIPKEVAELLQVNSGDLVDLTFEQPMQNHVIVELKSGTEVYGPTLTDCILPNDLFIVTVRRHSTSNAN
jgi:hypothetical protein